ncbi:unnamed protein product [Protopolystoma xenopodis]|uniref:Uncharacterized protein n=1 Tax=Protopolystoma xenopodis TaxID=117903 RepID=A0A3S5AH10_9PLAT|nr:unnamed protein product [Protopolystoma xenopodis]
MASRREHVKSRHQRFPTIRHHNPLSRLTSAKITDGRVTLATQMDHDSDNMNHAPILDSPTCYPDYGSQPVIGEKNWPIAPTCIITPDRSVGVENRGWIAERPNDRN